jgi:hypothetical protein
VVAIRPAFPPASFPPARQGCASQEVSGAVLRLAALAGLVGSRRFAATRRLGLVRRLVAVVRFAVVRRLAVVRRFNGVRFFRDERDAAARFLRFAMWSPPV